MKFFANNASIEYRKPQKGVAGALFSRLLALLIIAILLCANAGTAFAGETSSEAVLAGPTAGDTSEETVQAGSSSDESLADSALAGAESGQDAIGRDGDDRNVSGQEVIEQDDADQDISGQEDMRQDSGGRDVTVHFGEDEDRAIHIHVNSASGEEVESGMDDETGLEAETEEAKKVFFYEDSKVRVTATLETPGAVPAEAEFRVTEVTPDSAAYNYDAYMEALNEHAASAAAQGEDTAFVESQGKDADSASVQDEDLVTSDQKSEDVNPNVDLSQGLKYTSNTFDETNTLLYDVAFIMQSYDEDGHVIEGGEYEFQPEEGAVEIRIEFKKSQLTDDLGIADAQDVTIAHLPLSEEVRESVNTTADATKISASDINVESVKADSVTLKDGDTDQAAFQVESFSLISISGNGGGTIEATPFSSFSIEELLGESINYGVVANVWHFRDDSETSFAVWKFLDGGNDNGSDDAKSMGAECQYIMVGQIAVDPDAPVMQDGVLHLKGYKAYIKSPYNESDGKIQYGTSWSHSNMVFSYMSEEDVKAAVGSMIANAQGKSDTLKNQNSISNYSAFPDADSANHYTLDFTGLEDGTYCIDVSQWSALKKSISTNGGLTIKKNRGQKIVFNYPGTDDVVINKYAVINDGVFEDSVTIANHTTADSSVSEDIVFNIPEATHVSLTDFAGVVLAPKADVHLYGVGGGWVICNNFNNHNEWHYLYHKVYEVGDTATFQARKRLGGTLLTSDLKFHFRLEEKDSESETGWKVIQEDVENNNSWLRFAPIEYGSGNWSSSGETQEFIYRITEQGEKTVIGGKTYYNDPTEYYAKVTVTKQEEGSTTSYIASHPVYYSDADCTNELTTVSGFPEFNNHESTTVYVEKRWFRGTSEIEAPIDSIGYKLYRRENSSADQLVVEPETQTGNGREELTDFKITVFWSNYEDNSLHLCNVYQVHSDNVIQIQVTVPNNGEWNNVTLKPKNMPGEYYNSYAGDVQPYSNETEGGLRTYVYRYKVPSVRKLYEKDWKEYELHLIMNHNASSDMSEPVVNLERNGLGASFDGMMTHAGAKEAASKDKLVASGTLSNENGWRDRSDPQPLSGISETTGELVYYSYYVVEDVEDDTIYETYYDNNEGIACGNIVIYNKLPDTNQEYTSLTVKKEWKSSSDPQTDITSSKQGHILFEIRRVLKYSNGVDVPNSDVRYTGGTLEKPISGAVERLEDGTYKISSKEDGVDESGKTKYVWHPASIVNLPLHEQVSDGSETYTCVYYVHELPGDYQEDTTYQVGSVSGGSCVATNNGATVIIINREMASYALPATGGAGTRRIYLVSIMLIVLAGVGLILVRRRREMTR